MPNISISAFYLLTLIYSTFLLIFTPPSFSLDFSSYSGNSLAEDSCCDRQEILNPSRLVYRYSEHCGILIRVRAPRTCATVRYYNIVWCSLPHFYVFHPSLLTRVVLFSIPTSFYVQRASFYIYLTTFPLSFKSECLTFN
jgi:hypothetical protein